MKYLVRVIIGLVAVSTVHAQHATRPTIRRDESANSRQTSVTANLELTALTGIRNGPVFVGGYVLEEDNRRLWSRSLLWKIAGLTTTVREVPGNPEEFFWLDETTGWIYAAGDGVYKTTDGGDSWEKQSYPGDVYGNVFFLDRTLGWYFGYNEHLMRVEGRTMRKLSYFPDFPKNRKLQFVSANTGWLKDVVDGHSRFQRTNDGGNTWKVVVGPFTAVDSFQFLDENRGYVATPSGLYSTSDGGFSWNLILTVKRSDWIARMYFLSPDIGWTFGRRICMTRDSGQSWRCTRTPKTLDGHTVKGFVFTNESDGWLLIDKDLFFTNDGGGTWTRKRLTFGEVTF